MEIDRKKFANKIQSADSAEELCYTLDSIIADYIVKNNNPQFIKLLTQKTDNIFDKLIEWMQSIIDFSHRHSYITYYENRLKDLENGFGIKELPAYEGLLNGARELDKKKGIRWKRDYKIEENEEKYKQLIIEYINNTLSETRKRLDDLEFGKKYLSERIKDIKEGNIQPNQPTTTNITTQQNKTDNTHFEFDTQKISLIFHFCSALYVEGKDKDYVFEIAVKEIDLINSVAKADFREIYDNSKKTKCKYLIYFINNYIMQNAEWYKKAAQSIDTEPVKCSGANVPFKWKNELGSLQKELKK